MFYGYMFILTQYYDIFIKFKASAVINESDLLSREGEGVENIAQCWKGFDRSMAAEGKTPR